MSSMMIHTAIIPCRNEEGTVSGVVRQFVNHPLIQRVVVVMDPESIDNSVRNLGYDYAHDMWRADLASKDNGKVVIHHSTEAGKGQCVAQGLEYVETDRVVFCDADLTGLTYDHVTSLVTGRGLIIGVPDYPKQVPYPFTSKSERLYNAWPWVSGERSLPTWIARQIPLHGYLMEVQINAQCKIHCIPPTMKNLHGVTAPLRFNEQRLIEMERDRKWGLENGVLDA